MRQVRLLRINATAVLVWSFFAGFPAWAANETPAEIAMLPPYCDARIGSRSPETVAYWQARLGRENWIHMHHYCGGLVSLNRYYRQTGASKAGSLRNALWEFNYVLDHTGPGFPMRSDLYYNRGKVLRLQGKDGMALADLEKALELNPGMPAASIELASLYHQAGKKEVALSVLKSALDKLPEHKGLRRKYQEMGGNLTAVDEPPAITAPAADKVDEVQAVPVSPESADPVPPTPSVSEQKIGNQTNPWCRFCPESSADSNKPKAE